MKTILVVDDEPVILTLLRYNLEQEHFKVMTATDGAQALTMALQQKIWFYHFGFDVTQTRWDCGNEKDSGS